MKIIIFCLILFLSTPSYAISNEHKLFIGVNGHPLTQEGYESISIDQQIKLLKELNINWYRVDVNKNLKKFDELVTLSNRNNINILPIIFSPINLNKENDLKIIYQASYNYSLSMAIRFKNSINIWELGNELSNFVILKKNDKLPNGNLFLSGTPDGNNITDYDSVRYLKVKTMLEAMSNGIHDGNPNADRIIGAGWLHYGFIKKLTNDNVKFEILGWHWYSDMGSIVNVPGKKISLLNELKKFKKEIWITEGNSHNGSLKNEEYQYNYLKRTLSDIKSYYPDIKSYFIYELLDEPYFGKDNGESYYGLVSVDKKDKKWLIKSKKKSFDYIKKINK